MTDVPLEVGRSRDRVLEILLRSEEPLGVQSLAARLGLSRNAAHQLVSALEREGLIERAATIRTKGRPSRGFRLSAAGKATFPRQYSLLASQLLAELSRHLPPDQLNETMERIGTSLASTLPRIDPASDESIPQIAALMRDLGYESKAVEGEGELEIEAHNCVFHDLAMTEPAVCEVDLSLLRNLSGKTVEHRSCMARGARSCRFAFGSLDWPGTRL
jgi:predicted ArsR family transcriptional regulator